MKLNKYGCCPSGDVCLKHQSPLITFGICEDSPELKDFILKTREDTLRQVLQKQEHINNGDWNFINGYSTRGRDIEDKAKELWGIDLTNIK